VKALKILRKARNYRREVTGTARMQRHEAELTSKLVIEAQHVNFDYGNRLVVQDFSTTIIRGDKVCVIGPNGSGKTIMFKISLGDLKPQSGSIRYILEY